MLVRLELHWRELKHQFAQLSFSQAVRLDFYRSLLVLLQNQVRLNEALQELYRVYSDDEKSLHHPVAVVIQSCLEGMNEGNAFTTLLTKWVPSEEGMLLQAGERSGKLDEAFVAVEKIMEAKKEIVGAIAGAVTYPLFLFMMMGFLLHKVAVELVPRLAQMVDPQHWTGAAALLYQLAQFVQHYGLYTVIGCVLFFLVCILTLGQFVGPLRIWLDRFPPWSLYRMVQGATFLLNISALIRSGMQLHLALERLSDQANPWLRERIEATLMELSCGKNLGEALRDTGYHFPDKKANHFLAVIASYSGVDIAMTKFGNSWLEETVLRIQRVSKLLLGIGITAVGITILIVLAGAGGLQQAMQASFQ